MTGCEFENWLWRYSVALMLALLTLGTICGAIGVYCLARSVFG
jgi:hypothetical protein